MIPQQVPLRTCLECGRPLYGRRNKRHCNNRCRNARHNKKRDPAGYQAQVARSLKKNYRLLLPLLVPFTTGDMTSVPLIYLAAQDYDFTVFTGSSINPKTNGVIYWVYTLGLEQIDESEYYRLNFRGEDGLPQL